MENKELRIGNYLMGKNGFVVVSEIISENRVRILNNKSSFTVGICLDPIPLTEEWLVKFGFVCHSDGYCHLPTKGISFNDYKSNMINLCVGTYCQEGENLPHIKHVHQLQNLYFALTKQELTINE